MIIGEPIFSKSTRVLHTNQHNIEEVCRFAGEVIRRGGLVAFPTETVYGLGADALNQQAVKNIFSAKERPADNPLIVHVSCIDEVKCVAKNTPEIAQVLMDAFWPGPLTLVLPRKNIVPDVTTGGLDTVAVRMPDHPVALGLIREAGVPIAAPSANTSGKPSPTTAQHVMDDLGGRIDMIIDGGRVVIGVESTVIDVTGNIPTLLRPGGVGIEALQEIVGRIRVSTPKDCSVPRSPGVKYTHYSPEATVVLVTGDDAAGAIKKLAEEYEGKIGLLLCKETAETMGDNGRKIILGSRSDVESIARNLFYSLRLFDKQHVELIIADGSFSVEGVGLAVMNRLKKASSKLIHTRCRDNLSLPQSIYYINSNCGSD